MNPNRDRTTQTDFIYLITLVLQYNPTGGDFGKNIRSVVYGAATLTHRDKTEYGTGAGGKKLLVGQRFNNIISNSVAVDSGLFVRTGVRGFFQLTPFGMNISQADLLALLYPKKSSTTKCGKKRIAPLPFNEDTIIEEGVKSTRTVMHRNRSIVLRVQKVIDNKKKDPDGLSRCYACNEVCEYDIEIDGVTTHVDTTEVHHVNKLSETDDSGNRTKYSEAKKHVVCLCPGCHSILHKISPLPHPDELKEFLDIIL